MFKSTDTVAEEELLQTYLTEFLNSLTLSGLPPHVMALKVGSPVMLLCNLHAGPGNGLHNGTQMIVVKLGHRVIEAQVASGVNKGKCVLIPHITLIPLDTQFPFMLKWHQFPIRPCFAMTTNKAQGQTLDFVGDYLPEDVFTHGQLYVAFSWVRNSTCLAVLLEKTWMHIQKTLFIMKFLTKSIYFKSDHHQILSRKRFCSSSGQNIGQYIGHITAGCSYQHTSFPIVQNSKGYFEKMDKICKIKKKTR